MIACIIFEKNEVSMITFFSVENFRDTEKKLELKLNKNLTPMNMGRLQGKTTIGKALVNSLCSNELHSIVADTNSSYLSDEDILSKQAVVVTYKGVLDNCTFQYQICLLSRDIVKSEHLKVDGRVVFQKTTNNLDCFELNLPGAESLKTNLHGNRRIRLLNYVRNNSIFDKNTNSGKVVEYLYKLSTKMMYLSSDCVIKDGYEISALKYISQTIDPRKNPEVSSDSINEALEKLFIETELDSKLKFSVKFTIDDFEGQKIKVVHDEESHVLNAASSDIFKHFILISLYQLYEKDSEISVFDGISGVLSSSKHQSVINKNKQVVTA